MTSTYRRYFDIDPDYFPTVNESVIRKNPDMWKKYYPHKSFVKLMEDTVRVLRREEKLSIWVEGAYGTGKSHAVLTMKNLLEASDENTRAYFDKFELDQDLYNKLEQVKHSGTILTVHRYGSSAIRGDQNLIFAIQESIEEALTKRGVKNSGRLALKDAILKWLEDDANRNFFNSLITGEYRNLFGGDDVNEVIHKLNTFSGGAILALMDKIFQVADERQIKVASLDAAGLVEWIKDVIKANDLKAIVFIWDEFSEYFMNNARNLTGFQEIVELSATELFYFMIVTHKSAALFDDTDKDKMKILDRFVKPTCMIELPEHTAFQLMGAAMEKKQDSPILKEWQDIVGELYARTHDSRVEVEKAARIGEKELKGILPIHPYAALVLKHISTAFESNQRSMFDFIKNDRGDEIKGFQWFIDNHGPLGDNPLFTIDLLWEFFYEKGKEHLSHDVRSILDSYGQAETRRLSGEERRVLKTVLLLQAISQRVGDAVELFIPNEKNVSLAFEGTDMSDKARQCADKLVRDQVLYRKNLGSHKFQYSALVDAGDWEAIAQFKKDMERKSTSVLLKEGEVAEAIALGGPLRLRYHLCPVSSSDFPREINKIQSQPEKIKNKIVAVVCFAKDDGESIALGKKIRDALLDQSYDMVFVDASTTPLGADGYNQYCENMAQAMYYRGKDNHLAQQYEANAKEELRKWKNRIADGEFMVYTQRRPEGVRAPNLGALYGTLREINRETYGLALENRYELTDVMYTPSALKQGVSCAVNQELKGPFRSMNEQTKLENVVDKAWQYDGPYWVDCPSLSISKIKLHVDETIQRAFADEGGRVSIASIYEELQAPPFGFMPCNLTAFVLGFVLKEYVDGSYTWSDGLTNEVLDLPRLQEMTDEVIKQQITPNPRYKDKYIVAMTDEEKAFNEATAIAFDIPAKLCTSVEQTRERVRMKMKDLVFPVWVVKTILDQEQVETDRKVLGELIDYYVGLANSQNIGGSMSDNAIAYELGRLSKKHKKAANDLRKLFTKEKCSEGMKEYLRTFEGGELLNLSQEVEDDGQYMNVLRRKFQAADAAAWVWNEETAQEKIRDVILEYKIIAESNKLLPKATSFDKSIAEWLEKSDNIKISYQAAKNDVGSFGEFLKLLSDMKASRTLLDSQKQNFYDLLVRNAEQFQSFYNNQTDWFKRICSFYLDDFEGEELLRIFNTLPSGMLTADKSSYLQEVKDKVDDYKLNSKSAELKSLWKENTGTDSPRDWSDQYQMPILCMVDGGEYQEAKAAFETVNQDRPDEGSVERAMFYFSNASIFSKLNDAAMRDQAFRENVLGHYDMILPDVDAVKDYLTEKLYVPAYEWLGLPELETKLRQLAEAKYSESVCEKILARVEQMSSDEVKAYVKELIKNDMTVGMAMVRDNVGGRK